MFIRMPFQSQFSISENSQRSFLEKKKSKIWSNFPTLLVCFPSSMTNTFLVHSGCLSERSKHSFDHYFCAISSHSCETIRLQYNSQIEEESANSERVSQFLLLTLSPTVRLQNEMFPSDSWLHLVLNKLTIRWSAITRTSDSRNHPLSDSFSPLSLPAVSNGKQGSPLTAFMLIRRLICTREMEMRANERELTLSWWPVRRLSKGCPKSRMATLLLAPFPGRRGSFYEEIERQRERGRKQDWGRELDVSGKGNWNW